MAVSLNQEDIQAIVEAIKPAMTEISNQVTHSALTKRNKSYEDKLDVLLEQKISTASSSKSEPKVEEESERLTLKTLKEKVEEDNRKLREELRQEKEANQRKSMRSTLESQLLKSGIPANMLKAVTAQLIHEDKLVDLDKSGNPVFKVSGYNNETMPLEDGLSEWLKSDGKSFIPAPTARGAGLKTIKSSSITVDEDSSQLEKDADLFRRVRNM